MKTAIFIPVRLGSTRMPGKAFFEIKGKPFIEHLINRVKQAEIPDLTVLCTTNKPSDLPLVELAQKVGINHFVGDEKDILARFLGAAEQFNIDEIASVDGDDVFCDPKYIDKCLKLLAEKNADFVACKDLPLGVSPNVFTVNALRKVCELKKSLNTETGWGRYFTQTGLFKVEYCPIEADDKHPEIRLTLDYPEDFKLITTLFDHLYTPNKRLL
jgi:spore coat polysaccharide biosynthesis protein SpsF